MKLYEQVKVINPYYSVYIRCHYKHERESFDGSVKVETYSRILHDGNLCDMDFMKFFDAMYYEVEEIYPKCGQICIECHPVYKD